jgi:membrane fusion protein, multidrug efflux system
VSSEFASARVQAAAVVLIVAMLLAAGCTRAPGAAGKQQPAAAAQRPLLISPEDLLVVGSSTLASGPSITGSVQPERRADLRAEVSAVVLAVLKENGDPVKRGDLLVHLDDTAIRDSLVAAEASSSAAVQAFDQAERQLQRMATLKQTGVVSATQVEDVEIRRNTAQSERAAAKTRVVTARQQLAHTEVRAPFDGIVSDRKVSAGDTAQIGKELLKVIDPASLRFEGLVSTDSIGAVNAGQRVTFRVHGFNDREFLGTITRVNPAANATTRQVEVLVAFDDAKQQPNVAGLYAEGRIETRHDTALAIPASALVREGDDAFAWRVQGDKLAKLRLVVGERDARSGQFVVRSGLAVGDALLRYPSAVLRDGQPLQIVPGAKP